MVAIESMYIVRFRCRGSALITTVAAAISAMKLFHRRREVSCVSPGHSLKEISEYGSKNKKEQNNHKTHGESLKSKANYSTDFLSKSKI